MNVFTFGDFCHNWKGPFFKLNSFTEKDYSRKVKITYAVCFLKIIGRGVPRDPYMGKKLYQV